MWTMNTKQRRRAPQTFQDIEPIRPQPGPQENFLASSADIALYGGSAGGGKGLALDTPLPTPAGFTPMGAVKVGDTLFDELGQTCRVTAVSDISHRPVFAITFDDGTVIKADDVHRWLTFNAKELGACTRLDDQWRKRRRERRRSRVGGKKSEAFTAMIVARNKANPPPTLQVPSGTV